MKRWWRLISSSLLALGLLVFAQTLAPALASAHVRASSTLTVDHTACPANSLGARKDVSTCTFEVLKPKAGKNRIAVRFTLPKGDREALSLGAYVSTGRNDLASQQLISWDSGTFPGDGQIHKLVVYVPSCGFQVDFVHGPASRLRASYPVYHLRYIGAAFLNAPCTVVPPTTVAPTTTGAPTTTVAPTTAGSPTTTGAPTTTVAPTTAALPLGGPHPPVSHPVIAPSTTSASTTTGLRVIVLGSSSSSVVPVAPVVSTDAATSTTLPTLVLGSSSEATGSTLPFTGVNVIPFVLAAAALIGLGGFVLYADRRKHNSR